MRDSITISIPKPCHEKWDDFIPTARGGFCAGSTRKSITYWVAALAATLALITSQTDAGTWSNNVFTEVHAADHTGTTRSLKNDTTRTVTGIVRSSLNGVPISRVRVVRKNTLQEVTTDSTGRFTIVIVDPKPEDTLVFNAIGFLASEQSVPALGVVDVVLDDLTQMLSGRVGCFVAVRRYSPRNIWWKIRNIFR